MSNVQQCGSGQWEIYSIMREATYSIVPKMNRRFYILRSWNMKIFMKMAIKNWIKTENINCWRVTINLAQFTGSNRSRTKLLEVYWIAVRFFMHNAYWVQSLMWQKDVLPHLMNDTVQWFSLQHVVANNVAHYIKRSKESKNTHLLNGRQRGLRWSKHLRYTKLKLFDVCGEISEKCVAWLKLKYW